MHARAWEEIRTFQCDVLHFVDFDPLLPRRNHVHRRAGIRTCPAAIAASQVNDHQPTMIAPAAVSGVSAPSKDGTDRRSDYLPNFWSRDYRCCRPQASQLQELTSVDFLISHFLDSPQVVLYTLTPCIKPIYGKQTLSLAPYLTTLLIHDLHREYFQTQATQSTRRTLQQPQRWLRQSPVEDD